MLLLLLALVLLAGSMPGSAPSALPEAVAVLLAPQTAQAQAAEGGNFGSAVPCLEAPDQFVTSCFANTLVSDSDGGANSTSPVASSDTALVRFNTGSKAPLASLGQIGSVYGMAYDDGRASGTRRLLLGAFARRMTGFGPGGPGAIYQYNLVAGTVSLFATVPGATNRHVAADINDDQVATWVGKSSLGDLEIGPSGTTLYAMNLDTRQIDRFDLRTGTQLASLAINFAAITGDPAAQADLRPFGMEFQPTLDGNAQPLLAVGLVDSGERAPNTTTPTAYVIEIAPTTGTQTTLLAQPLNDPAIEPRFDDSVNAGQPAWHAWTPTGSAALWPMPILSDIQFSRDGLTMLLGFRDRNGDVYRADKGDAWWRVQEQGDVLAYRLAGGSWQLQTRGGINTPSDYFHDNHLGPNPSDTTTAHVENFMGALAWTLSGSGGTLTEQIVGTAITPLLGGTTGANWYNLAPSAYDRTAAVEIVPQGDLWKSATLGDLENLCTVAFIGDRVWNDANGNGVQDAGEGGIGGVLLSLLDVNGAMVAQATTDAAGSYQFAVQPGVAYSVEVAASNFGSGRALFGRIISPQNRGGNDALDSDADQITRRVGVPAQLRDAYNRTFDVGVMNTPFANGIVGDRVWNDANGNGVQDGGEPSIPGVTIRLINTSTGATVGTDTTDGAGLYQFINIIPGTYAVEFVPPAGINAAPRNAGGNDAADSDADASTGWRTPAFDVTADTVNLTLDLGLLMNPNVWARKTGPATAVTGSQYDYTIAYGNSGQASAANVAIVDTLPAGVSFVSAVPAPSSVSGQQLTWSVGTLAPGGANPLGSIAVRVQVAAGAPASVTNNVAISTTTSGDSPGDNTGTVTTQITRPNVYVQKTGPAVATAGGQVSYTLAYGNNGSAAAGGVGLTDTLPPELTFVSAVPAPSSVSGQALTWNLGTLAAGATGSVTVVAQASAAAANGVVVTNQASIATGTPGDTPGDNTSSTATTLQRADVRVTKSSPTSFPVVSGQPVTYHIDFANAGPAAAANVTLTDSVPPQLANVSWSCASGCSASGTGNSISIDLGTLAAGATGRVTVTGTAQTGLAREDFTNTATIATSTPETDTANNQSSVPGAVWTSDVQVIKLAQAQVVAGETFTATLAYRNNGPAPADDVILTDTLPAGVALVSASPAPSSVSGQALTWSLGGLADGQAGSVALVLQSDPALANNATVVNQSQIGTTTADRDAANNRSDAATLAIARADLAAAKSGPARVSAGDTVEYSLSYRNDGPSIARGAVLTDTLPAELDFVLASPAPASNSNGVLTWALGDLAPGQGGTITVQMASRFAQAAPVLTARNMLAIGSATPDPAPENNTSAATTDVETANVSVIKSSPPVITAGTPFTVTLDYRNAGPAVAKNVMLRDVLPSGLMVASSSPPPSGPGLRWSLGDLPAGASGSVVLVLRAPADAISGTTYVNVALIDTPTSSDRDPSNDTSSTVSTARPSADLSVLKSGPTAPIRSGSVVTYTLTYRNAGPSQAQVVRIEDTPPPGFTFQSATPAPTSTANGRLMWDIGTLDAGASGSIAVSGTLLGDGAATTRTNLAAIDSPTTPDPAPDNNTSTVDTPVRKPDLSVTKTDNVAQAQPGDRLTYDLTVRNTGAATATGVLLREAPPAGVTVLSNDWARQSDGAYTLAIGDLGPGQSASRQFAIQLPNPLPAALADISNVVVVMDDGSAGPDPTPGDNTSTDTDVPRAGRIGDFVWYDKDGDGRQDDGERGFGDVVVQLLDPDTGQVIATTTTDANGHYMFAGLRMSTYAVALAAQTTQIGALRGYRYTTPLTPIGAISDSAPDNLALDIGLNDPGTTDVVLAYLHAEEREDGSVTVRWSTLEEINTLRFRVLRGTASDPAQAAEIASVPSQGSAGGVYSVTDAAAPAGALYWLVEVERGGRETTYGPLGRQTTPTIDPAAIRAYMPIAER
jgi:uncharacterized repeat protein (TIGR01451 family)